MFNRVLSVAAGLSGLQKLFIAGAILAFMAGALYAVHVYQVNQAFNDGFEKGEIAERGAWEIEVHNLRAALKVQTQREQGQIDTIQDGYFSKSKVLDSQIFIKQGELSGILKQLNENAAKLEAANNEGSKNEKPIPQVCDVNPYDDPLDGRILRNLNAGR